MRTRESQVYVKHILGCRDICQFHSAMLSNVHVQCPCQMSMFIYSTLSLAHVVTLHWENLQLKPPEQHQVSYLDQLEYVHNSKPITMEHFTDGLQGNLRPVPLITSLPSNSLCTHPLSADHGQAGVVPVQVSPQPNLPTAQSPYSPVSPQPSPPHSCQRQDRGSRGCGATLHYTTLHHTLLHWAQLHSTGLHFTLAYWSRLGSSGQREAGLVLPNTTQPKTTMPNTKQPNTKHPNKIQPNTTHPNT